jgi:hypothetical protein
VWVEILTRELNRRKHKVRDGGKEMCGVERKRGEITENRRTVTGEKRSKKEDI